MVPLVRARFQLIPKSPRKRAGKNSTGSEEAGSRGDRPVALYVRNNNRAARLVKPVATCGPLDMDDPQPGITLMMPDED